jgi:hypothetical protein
MTINQPNKIDFVTDDYASSDVYLTISDHMDWNENEGEHLLLLQEKINSYLTFIESGQLFSDFPKTRGKKIIISIMGKFPLSSEAQRFFDLAKNYVENAGFNLEFKLHKPLENS